MGEPSPPDRGRLGLLTEPDFRRLWMADILSQVGTRLSLLAVPLLALYTLDASTFEVAGRPPDTWISFST